MGNYISKTNKMYEKHCKLKLTEIKKSNLKENILVIGLEGSGKTTLIDFLTGFIIRGEKFFKSTKYINIIEYTNFIFYDTPGLSKDECDLIKRKDKHFLHLVDEIDTVIICVGSLEREQIKRLLDFVEDNMNIDTKIIVIKTRLLEITNGNLTYEDANNYVRKELQLPNEIDLFSISTVRKDLFDSALNKKWGYDKEIMRDYILNMLSPTPNKPELLIKPIEKYFNYR